MTSEYFERMKKRKLEAKRKKDLEILDNTGFDDVIKEGAEDEL